MKRYLAKKTGSFEILLFSSALFVVSAYIAVGLLQESSWVIYPEMTKYFVFPVLLFTAAAGLLFLSKWARKLAILLCLYKVIENIWHISFFFYMIYAGKVQIESPALAYCKARMAGGIVFVILWMIAVRFLAHPSIARQYEQEP